MAKKNKSPDITTDDVIQAELANELTELLTPEELANAVNGARSLDPNRDSSMLSAPISDNGKGEFHEAEHKRIIITDEAKLNMTQMIAKPGESIKQIMPSTEIPGCILMDMVMGIHIDEMLDPERAEKHPDESPEDNMFSTYGLAMKGFNRKGLKELLQLGEQEAMDKGMGDNMTPQVIQ